MEPSNSLQKQDPFRHILKSSVSMYESSGSQFFRTTTARQAGLDAFDESRFTTTFLTIFQISSRREAGKKDA